MDIDLLREADNRALNYEASVDSRAPYPDASALAGLEVFQEAMPNFGRPPIETLDLLDTYGSAATAVTTGPRYFGYVVGGTLPIAAAAERLVLAWDQRASTYVSSPVADTIEAVAGKWVTETLDLPRESAVGFGTSATACTIAALSVARRSLLARLGWDWDQDGATGAPPIRVIVSDTIHVSVLKALRVIGFGLRNIVKAPVDQLGRVDPDLLPHLDSSTILILQAGEVNSGSFDPFSKIIPRAVAAGAWTHIDGAFGIWARVSSAAAALCDGIELADSWTADGHKWLNTPYDTAFTICKHATAFEQTLSSDAVYAPTQPGAQQNLTLEFSRRARGVSVWAALRSLGREGLAEIIDRNIAHAKQIAAALATAGFEVLVPVVLNQVIARASNEDKTTLICQKMQQSGIGWFGLTRWKGEVAIRISISSYRTKQEHVDDLIAALVETLRMT